MKKVLYAACAAAMILAPCSASTQAMTDTRPLNPSEDARARAIILTCTHIALDAMKKEADQGTLKGSTEKEFDADLYSRVKKCSDATAFNDAILGKRYKRSVKPAPPPILPASEPLRVRSIPT